MSAILDQGSTTRAPDTTAWHRGRVPATGGVIGVLPVRSCCLVPLLLVTRGISWCIDGYPAALAPYMNDRTLLRTGVAGTIIVALCCFTPVLVVLVGIVGLSAVTGYLDYVLFPALAFFLGLTIHALRRKRRMDHSNQQRDGT